MSLLLLPPGWLRRSLWAAGSTPAMGSKATQRPSDDQGQPRGWGARVGARRRARREALGWGMSDLWAVVLALAAGAGAWTARPFPVGLAALVAAVALARRQPMLLCIGTALLVSALGSRAIAGLTAPAVGPVAATVTLMRDPEEVWSAVRVEVRLGRRRVEAQARGRAAALLLDRLAGERVAVRGRLQRLSPPVARRLASRHLAAQLLVDDVGGWSRAAS